MGYWVKLYTDILDDPKYNRMPEETKVIFYEIILLAKKLENDELTGNIPEIQDIAFHLRRQEIDIKDRISYLVEIGIIEEIEEGYYIKNYIKRQSRVPAKIRVKEYRKKKNSLSLKQPETNIINTIKKQICDGEETKELQSCYEPVTKSNGETETETEKSTDKNTETDKKDRLKFEVCIKNIMSYLNQKTGRKWSNPFQLKQVLKKYSEKDVIAVIDFKMTDDFFLADNCKFMQPSTLFRKSNFEKYIEDLRSQPVLEKKLTYQERLEKKRKLYKEKYGLDY